MTTTVAPSFAASPSDSALEESVAAASLDTRSQVPASPPVALTTRTPVTLPPPSDDPNQGSFPRAEQHPHLKRARGEHDIALAVRESAARISVRRAESPQRSQLADPALPVEAGNHLGRVRSAWPLARPTACVQALRMGQAAEKLHRATYADVEAAPSNKVAELIAGTLYVMPRPAPRHARASSRLGGELYQPFDRGRGGPGGWVILDEPELHFPDPTAAGEIDAVVPDIAGWRLERMPELPEEAYFTLAPDWICEVLSSSTEDYDRDTTMPLYAREGVRHAWLIEPIAKTLEAYVLGPGRRWGPAVTYRDSARVRVEPFHAIELDLTVLWAK